MTPDEIRDREVTAAPYGCGPTMEMHAETNWFLREIAAQLAEANELARIGQGAPAPRKVVTVEVPTWERIRVDKLVQAVRELTTYGEVVPNSLSEALKQYDDDIDIPF